MSDLVAWLLVFAPQAAAFYLGWSFGSQRQAKRDQRLVENALDAYEAGL